MIVTITSLKKMLIVLILPIPIWPKRNIFSIQTTQHHIKYALTKMNKWN